MLDRLIQFSLTQRLFVLVVFAVLVLLGARAWQQIPVDAFPDISPTQVKLVLKAPGMTTEEIEKQITQPIETELLGIPRQEMLRSTTKYSITAITLDFAEGTDIYWARQQVSERLAGIMPNLPDIVSGGMAPMSTPLSEIFMFSVNNPSMSLRERRFLLDRHIRPLLRTVPGVADVNTLGGFVKTYEIRLDHAKMQQLAISIEEIEQRIRENNMNGGLGRLEQGNDTLIARTEGRFQQIEDLASLVIRSQNGELVRLSDVAEVSLGNLTRYGAVSKDGSETAQGLIIALKNANTAEVVKNIKLKLAELTPSLPEGTEINVFYDRHSLIDTAINTISSALYEAIALVIVILALFLANLRASLVVSLSLPLAALLTFILMQQAGLTANLMSLGGLVIAIGMLVDSSVVLVENIVNQLARMQQHPKLHAVYRACKEVSGPVVSGTIIVVIVFAPLLTLTGLEGKLFTPVALTIVFAMLSALVLSLTLIPAIASLVLKQQAVNKPGWLIWLEQRYRKSLQNTLSAPRLFVTVTVALFVASLGVFQLLGKSFMPQMDEGDIIVQLEKSPSITLSASVAIDKQVEQRLLDAVPEIVQIVARTGSDELGLDPMGLNETDVFMELRPSEEWRFATKGELIAAIREVLQGFPGMNIGFTQPIQMRVSEMLTGGTGDVSIKVFGEDMSTLAGLADSISAIAQQVDGAVDVKAAIIEGGDYLNIRLHQEVAQQFGLTTQGLTEMIKNQLEGRAVSAIIEGIQPTPIQFSASQANWRVSTTDDLASLPILLPGGEQLPLRELAELSFKSGPLLIKRERGHRFVAVSTNVEQRDVVGFVEELKGKIQAEVDFPAGYTVEFGGEFESQQRAARNLMIVVPAALLLIFFILFTTFNSVRHALLILANIPFAVMGGIFALYVTGEYVSVPASVGFIALLGVSVLNGVVMLSYFEQNRLLETRLNRRVVDGAGKRLRPILMTASTAIFGLLPLAFAQGPGAEIQKPLAIVVIGGLFTATVTTLYLLPVFYSFMERRHHE